jgi:hypothetical protein
MSTSQQGQFITGYVCRPALLKQLRGAVRHRINTVRKVISRAALPDEDIEQYLQSALAFGLYRVLINRFSLLRGLDDAWWIAARRKHGCTGKDRTHDHDIIVAEFPDFGSYVPHIPVPDEEVVRAAAQEFRDLIAGVGTDYHQEEMQRKQARVGLVPLATAGRASAKLDARQFRHGPRVSPFDPEAVALPIADYDSMDRVENAEFHRLMEDERNIFGPGVTRVMEIAVREYGAPAAIFWLTEWLFFPRRYSEVLRIAGLTEEELGAKEFERIKRDMVRKLPEMHARMLSILHTDPELRMLCGFDGERAQRTVGRVEQPAPGSSEMRAAIEREREHYVARLRSKMFWRIAQDRACSDHLATIEKTEAGKGMTDLLSAFQRTMLDEARWPAFVRDVCKAAKR